MVTSPSSSPPPKWNSNLRGGSGAGGGSGQLLQELEALSQALYQSQKKAPSSQSYPSQPSPQLQPQASPAKKHSFLSRKDASHLGRRLSHEPATDQTSSMEPIPYSNLSPNDPPPSFMNLLSRHSLSSAHAPSSFEQQKSAASNSRGRFSSSVVSSRKSSGWGEEKSEIRSRTDRQLSLPPSRSKNQEKSIPQEQEEWPEDSLESSRRFDSSSSDKKKSVWSSWKPLRALSHLGRQRLHCVFSAYVHAIEGLPPAMNGLRLCVHMRKEETREGAVQTMPSRVFQGIAEYQETLFMKCTLYGNKGPSNTMKFMEKAFIVSVIAPDIDELDFGRHQLDLSRLLGDFLEERKGQLEKGSSWDTVLDLTGKAKGGRLAITINYEILDKDAAFSGNVSSRFRESPPHRSSMHSSYSLPNSAHGTPRSITTRAHLSHSPSVSEPGNDYDDLLAMDQLNLDEPPPALKAPPFLEAQELRGGQTAEVQGFPAFGSQSDRPPIPSQSAFKAFPSMPDQISATPLPSQSSEKVFEGTAGAVKAEDELPSEEEDEFVVVDQGMEIDESVEKRAGNLVGEKELYGAEEEASDDLIPHLVEMDAMDDLPQVVDIEALDDHPQVVDMEAFDDLPPRVVQMQAFDHPSPSVDEMETLDVHNLQEPPSQVPEKEESHDHQCHESDEERSLKEDLNAEGQQSAAFVVGSSGDDKEVQEDVEKIVTVDEGERKDNVTYVMVMQTLDSLLQGTSAKELPQEEEKVEVESSADGIFSDEEDAANKEVINMTSLSTLEKDSKNSAMELTDDVYEDNGCDSEDFEEKGHSSKDINEVSFEGTAEEEEGPKVSEEQERHSDYTKEEEGVVKVERGMHSWEEEDKSLNDLEDEGEKQGGVKDERGMHAWEEEDKSSIDSEGEGEKQGGVKEERGMHAWDEKDKSLNDSEDEGEKQGGVKEERGMNAWEAENKSFNGSEDEGVDTNKQFEDEERDRHIIEEEGSSSSDINEEEGFTVISKSEKGLDGFEEEGSGYKDKDIVLNHSDKNAPNRVAEEESISMSPSADVSLPKGTTDSKVAETASVDMDSEVDLVAGEFLDMLGMGNTAVSVGYDSEVDSPRARLLKQFEQEALLDGGFGLDFDVPEFSLDGAYRDGDVGCPPTASVQGSAVKREDTVPSNWDSTSIQMEKESDHWQHAFTSICREEEVANQTLTSKGLSKESANWDHNLPRKEIEKESAGRDWIKGIDEGPGDRRTTTNAFKETGKELNDQDHTLALKGMEQKPTFLNLTLGVKDVDIDPANGNHPVAVETEPGHWNYALASKVTDEDLARWTDAVASKGMEKDPGMEPKSNDRKLVFPSEQMDEEPCSWSHTLALKSKKENPPSWDETSALKETDLEPVKLDHGISVKGSDKKLVGQDQQVPLQQINAELSHWGHSSASKELDREPTNRAPDLSSNTVDKEPAIWDLEEDEELMSFMEAAESELQRATQNMQSKSRAKMLEDAETEALMQEWGLNERAFVSSPPKATIRQQEPPPLGKGLGASVPLKDGGSLRSMNPSLFQANKSSGKLVMQISKPVVVPAEMGRETADILRNMASMGIENMAVQAMTAMPLEDITGRSVEQVAVEGATASKSGHRLLEGSSRKDITSRLDRKSRTSSQNIVDDFVSLEDIAPMAMQQIEALAFDGLKFQADAVEDDAPFAVNSFSLDGESGVRDMSAGGAILKGVTGVHLSKGPTTSTETSGDSGGEGLMGMAISLDEWMLLDAGLYDEAETKKDAMAIMAAHQAVHQEIVVAGDDEKRKKRQGSKSTGGRWGCMGNTLTIAMLVQLRDPLKNNEAVGAPMMAFVQAERLMKPPKLKVGRNVSMKGNSEDEEAGEPQFKIIDVHMSGLKTSQEGKKIGWGNQKQQQSGSRWLIANGMAKNAKVNKPMLGSKPAAMSSASSSKANANKGESLWSISSRALGTGLRWRDKLKLNASAR
ncbi:hypothetical protein GOP47_0018696 [Adiantum capillus-veneris]|uniref:C2 NT-type domain-containing protein n=1 Tax=Adiantum capillus-veneris TaxID=13818 RepID=A0A9D4UEA4_ADICA|nr:hypothetical protein GOP47_0018696 [Adiantum capillus-veneris]